MPDRPSDPFDPRYPRSRNPRSGLRDPDPSAPDYRDDPRYDPRDERYDPRFDSRDARYDPRYDPRHERYDARLDPRDDPWRDREWRAGAPASPPPPPAPAAPRRSTGRILALLAGLAALLLAGLFAYRMTRAGPGEDRLAENSVGGGGAPAQAADARCGSPQTYGLLKRELFRRAAQARGGDAGAFDRLSAYATLRVSSPVVKRQDEQLGTLVCAGNIALDLPPGVAVVGGRRTLTAETDYALQPAADSSGDVVTLSGADSIIVPLATLARTAGQPGVPSGTEPQPEGAGTVQPSGGVDTSDQPLGTAPPPPPPAPQPPTAPAPTQRSEPPAPPPSPAREVSSARPSFNCANARTRGELAVCRNGQLATLDRRMAAEFFGAVNNATPEQRALLQRTRGSFLAFRDRCTSDACIANAYQGRIREIRDIINDRWSPR